MNAKGYDFPSGILRFSIFRWKSRFELFFSYSLCFALNALLEYATTVKPESELLLNYIRNFTDYQIEITLALTLIVALFHYQFLSKSKTEIYCRLLAGSTLQKIRLFYITENAAILSISYFLYLNLRQIFSPEILGGVHLLGVFALYILISTPLVRSHESV